MFGMMQAWPLTVDKILDHAGTRHADREVVSRSAEGPIARTTYGQVRARAKQVSNALLDLGVRPGDRIGTLGWNTARHLEVWYGIMGIGAVCHTLNPRLFPDQLCYIIGHAEDKVLFTDLSFLPTIIERRVPDISPLYADLKGLCPALFSVGTKDALMDDTLFMHARWVAAGNPAELAVYPGGAHGFTLFPNALSKAAAARMDAFLNGVLG